MHPGRDCHVTGHGLCDLTAILERYKRAHQRSRLRRHYQAGEHQIVNILQNGVQNARVAPS